MSQLQITRYAALIATAIVCLACSEESNNDDVCSAGETQDCFCTPTQTGSQLCREDLAGWHDCDCGGPDGDADGDSDSDADGDGDVDGDSDADSDADWEPPPPVNNVDILFVIDNSGSMTEEQAELARQFEPLVRELLDPTDPGTGEIPPPVNDLHIGVVSSDMGTGGHVIMTCEDSAVGDDGVLHNAGYHARCDDTYSALDCDREECPWLSHSEARPDDGTEPRNPPIWEDFDCVATLGTEGCGFEQQLESSLAALTTQAAPGMPNAGFLRDDSLVVVIYVTDEDDCSAADPEMFNPARDDLAALGIRCAMEPEMLHPVRRYFDAITSLRGYVGHTFVAAITGIPVDGSWAVGDPLEDLQALVRENPASPGSLAPTCQTDMGMAFPPARIAELVYMFREYGYLASICWTDWTSTLGNIARRIQDRLER